jgi:hydrogenase maturation protease
MDRRTPLLILGLGNVLCSDDGLGVEAVRRLLEGWEPPEGVLVLDGGTLGLSLLPYLEDAERAILVDAIRTDDSPGTPVRLEGEEVAPAVAARLSPHQIGVLDLLDGARWRGRYPETVILQGLVPESLELSLDRSPAVEAELDGLVLRVVQEALRLGFSFQEREKNETRPSALRRGGGCALEL